MSLEEKYLSLKLKLEESGDWPAEYVFKFILKSTEKEKQLQIRQLFEQNVSLSFKSSSKGKYISATIKAIMADPDAIINVYKEAGKIEGLIVF